jgi:hypothetical protein
MPHRLNNALSTARGNLQDIFPVSSKNQLTGTVGTGLAGLVLVAVLAPWPAMSQDNQVKIREDIARLEKRLAEVPPGTFDFRIHNELRHLYGAVDLQKSMSHVDTILQHKCLDDYMKQVLGGKDNDPSKATEALTATAAKYPQFPNLTAACWIWAGDLAPDNTQANAYYARALAIPGLDAGYREAIEDRTKLRPLKVRPWPKKFVAPSGRQSSPGPWSDPDSLDVWPNTTSRANSDAWLVSNHHKIKKMRPRLLLINFSNEHSREHLRTLTNQLIFTLAESSRYHGYSDPQAPIFLEYQIFKFVDLRDKDSTVGNSSKIPVKNPNARSGYNMQYRQYFSDEFAAYYAVPDPREPNRFLRLDELLDGGYVQEVWFFESGNTSSTPHVGSYEVVEEKPRYDQNFQRIGNEWVQAGNGGDAEQPWTGRSCRIGCINASRGIGCFLESLAHGIERNAGSGAIPYFSKYFNEYAGFNLKERYNLPFDSLYAVAYGGRPIQYPNESTLLVTHAGKEYRVENYIPAGGNVHLPPNARGHYDLDNATPVLSTIEDWRIGSGPQGKDVAKPISNQAFRGYRDIAPDCMGAWLVYWRQNMPGLNNRQRDDAGEPMKNWIPFLFY